MRSKVPVILLALALLAPIALAQQGNRGTPPTPTPGSGEAEDDRGRGRGGDDRDGRPESSTRGRSEEHRPAAVGAFTLSTSRQTVQGDFVNFTYNDTDVQDFQVGGRSVFDLHVAGGRGEDEDADADAEREARARGAEVRIQTPFFKLRVHDNPAGVTKLETDGVATLLFAEGANLTQLDNERVRFVLGNLTGTLRGDDVRIAGRSVIAAEELLLLVNEARGGFDVHRADIGEAVAKRKVGAEASFNRAGDDDVEEDVVSYGNVTVHTVKAERGNLTVLIEGHGFEGRVVVLNVDGRVVGAASRDELNVLFDNMSMRHADSITDVLDPDDDGLQPEYYLVFDPAEDAFQLIVSVPHYSVHSLTIMTFVQVPPPSVVIGVLAGLMVLAASGFVLFRRKE